MTEERILTVLNVDDYPAALYATSRVLRQAGYRVLEATTGAEALARAGECPDLIILDVNLPDVDGFEVARRIKADPETATIPLLHMSAAYRDPEHRALGLEGGADAYLAQPVEPRELLATIRALLRVREAESVVRQSEERLRVLASATADVVWTTDARGRLTGDLPSWRDLTGQAPEELLGWGWLDAVHPGDRARIAQTWEDAVREQGTYDTEYRLRMRDGAYRIFMARGVPVLEPGGEIREWVGLCMDVEDRRRAEDRQRFLSDAGAVLAASLEAERMPGRLAEIAVPLLADSFSLELHPFEDGERMVASAPDRDALPVLPDEFEERLAAGETVALGPGELPGVRSYVAAPLIARGEMLGSVRMATGPSGRTLGRADAEALGELARRVALAVDNARLYTAALDASETKSEFLATMSHELRTPMNAILGYADLLDAEVAGPLTAAQREQLNRIGASARHLLQLIDEILTFSRIEAGREQVSVERFDLADLARDTAEMVEPMARGKDLRFPVDTSADPLWVVSDPGKVRQILLNLLSNAVKFTEAGEVRLAVRAEGDEAVLRVADTGIGIAPEQQERIFDAFWQVEQSSIRRAGGTGLGLSVTRHLVDMLGGSVEVASTRGEGSTFTVRIPLEAPSPPPPPSPKPLGEGGDRGDSRGVSAAGNAS
ncbi:MAG TPA: ATP-binding protein [Longimicrobium sp.]|jgi:PAS domain S-box-containing protein